jgi:hypothetical protein
MKLRQRRDMSGLISDYSGLMSATQCSVKLTERVKRESIEYPALRCDILPKPMHEIAMPFAIEQLERAIQMVVSLCEFARVPAGGAKNAMRNTSLRQAWIRLHFAQK